jgi:hypothetical protein
MVGKGLKSDIKPGFAAIPIVDLISGSITVKYPKAS